MSALVGTQTAEIELEATDTLAAKLNDIGRYVTGSVEASEDTTFSLHLLTLV